MASSTSCGDFARRFALRRHAPPEKGNHATATSTCEFDRALSARAGRPVRLGGRLVQAERDNRHRNRPRRVRSQDGNRTEIPRQQSGLGHFQGLRAGHTLNFLIPLQF